MPDVLLEGQAAQYFFAVLEILPGDLQPIAQLQGLKVSGRHARDHGEGDRLLVVAAGHGGGPGGIARRSILAPEVQLVARAEHGIEDVVDPERSARNAGARALAGGGCAQIDRGQERRAGDAQLRIRLLYAGDRRGQIIVALLRLSDQLVEPRRAEPMPPVGLRPDRCMRIRCRIPLRRERDVRSSIGGAHAAGRESRADEPAPSAGARLPLHGRHPEPGAVNRAWSIC